MARISADKEAFSEESEGSLKDVTPIKFRCAAMASCPAVLKNEKTENYVIIGRRLEPDTPGVVGRVAPHEVALEISAELLEGALISMSEQLANKILSHIGSGDREAAHSFLVCRRSGGQGATSLSPNEPILTQKETVLVQAS
jgi:hypothetical protein